ncbi:EAL domain-containing protein [Pseudorhodoferax sp. Leaf267]|uniref:sensor domain-containing protein n=1 Tax=Pseudorhodoferax sp. Leaf267 TaxID=1736316 RepID=UPI0009E7390E|nr:EAL domain-containing protein [Pseudorhodoferax sp. Leaf267]
MTTSSSSPVASRDLAERNAIIRTLDHVKAIAEFSPEGMLLYANPRYLEIFGYELDEVQGVQHAVFCEPCYAASEAYAVFWQRLREGVAYTDLCERVTRAGAKRWLEATYAPIFDAQRRVVRIFKMAGDVTARIERERQAQEETRRLSLVAGATGNAVIITGADWRIVYVNEGFTRMFGMTIAEAAGQVPPALLAPGFPACETERLHAELAQGISHERQELLRGHQGERYWCNVSTNPVMDAHHRLVSTVSVITDITESKMHQVMQHRVLEAIAAERSISDVATMVCEEVDRILPGTASCVLRFDAGGRVNPLAAPQIPRPYLEHLSRQTLHLDMVAGQEHTAFGADGVLIDITSDARWRAFRDPMLAVGYRSFWAVPIRTVDGSIAGAVVFHYAESRVPDGFHRKLMAACVHLCALALERERSKARIHRLAFYDPLTNLPNRSLLKAKAEQALATSARNDTPVAVVFIDLDRFKHVNDSLGHPAGDQMLKTVAARLLQDRRSADIVARLSGDEFLMVLPACNALQTAEMVERVQAVLHQPVSLGGTNIRPCASLGIAMFPADGTSLDVLMHRADMAMYQAKSEARGSFAFFSSELNAQAQERLSLEADLEQAVHEGALHLHYQPQVDLATNALHGVEVLSRWHHPVRGNVPPITFIPLAEACSLIDGLSRWVLRTACAQLAAWRARGLQVPTLSINFSALTLHDDGLPRLVEETLRAHGLRPCDLIIEITEGVMLDHHAATVQTITALQALGVRMSMDDFGTGYSSLSYLHRLPITELKIDRSFVADLGFRDSALPLCRAIVQIGKSLGLIVVAEGVETQTQRQLLTQEGCHVAQGYLFSRPLSARDFEEWARSALAVDPEMRQGARPAALAGKCMEPGRPHQRSIA